MVSGAVAVAVALVPALVCVRASRAVCLRCGQDGPGLPVVWAQLPPERLDVITGFRVWWAGTGRRDYLRGVCLPRRVLHWMGWWP